MTAPISAINSDLDIAELLTDHILDEDLDPQQIAILLSAAKNKIELELKLELLLDEDVSQTRASGDSYTTMKSLPDNFREMLELYVGTTLYRPIPFRKRTTFRFSDLRYYIDYKNRQFAICGNGGSSQVIKQVYLIKTDDFTSSSVADASAATLTWPKEFWGLVAWEAAYIISSGTDIGADDISFRMSESQKKQRDDLLHSLRMWDHDLKLAQQGGRSTPDEDDEPGFDEILARM
jgi:hypothetical protein